MEKNEQINTCYEELERLVRHWALEFNLTHADIIAILEVYKTKYIVRNLPE